MGDEGDSRTKPEYQRVQFQIEDHIKIGVEKAQIGCRMLVNQGQECRLRKTRRQFADVLPSTPCPIATFLNAEFKGS
jgi:hypothetical protein